MRKFKVFSKKYHAFKRHKVRRIQKIRKHPFIVPVITFLGLFMVVAIGFVLTGSKPLVSADSHVVIVSHDNKQQTIPTRANTVGELLTRLNITLGENDIVEPTKDSKIQEDNFRINVYRARPITVVDGDKRVFSVSAISTPRTIAKQAGVSVYPEDRAVAAPVDNVLKDGIGEKIVITRSVPITLNLYGTSISTRTLSKTVGDLLKEKHIKAAKDDVIQPVLNAPITDGAQVFVLRKGTQIATITEDIPAPTQIINDRTLSYGTSVTRQKGSPGKKAITYTIGPGDERTKIQEVNVLDPVPEIIARGSAIDIPGDRTKIMEAAGLSPGEYGAVNYIISRESNWRPSARNASGCLGLGQRCPGSVLINACPNWEFDPVCQLRHFTAYANGRNFAPYGTGWNAAYQYWLAHGNW